MPAVESCSTEDVTTATTSHDFIVPTTAANRLIVFGTGWSTPTSSAFDVTPPSTDWTEVYDEFISAASNAGGGLWYIYAATPLSSSVNFQTNQSVGRSVIGVSISDADPNTPVGDSAAINTGNSNSPASNSATAINSSSLLIWWQANDDDDVLSSFPTGMTEIAEADQATPSNGRHVSMAFESVSTGVYTRTGTLAASEEWACGKIVVNPILTSYEFSGVTKDDAGSTLGGVDVFAVIDSTAPSFVGFTTSSSDGAYSFSGVSTDDHTTYGFLDGSTNRMDISDPITPTEI